MRKTLSLSIIFLLACSTTSWGEENVEDPAAERTRKTVKMLDDIYKTAVVLITDKYVESEDDFPAGTYRVRHLLKTADQKVIRLKGDHLHSDKLVPYSTVRVVGRLGKDADYGQLLELSELEVLTAPQMQEISAHLLD